MKFLLEIPIVVVNAALICAINSSGMATTLTLNQIAQLEGGGVVEAQPDCSMSFIGTGIKTKRWWE